MELGQLFTIPHHSFIHLWLNSLCFISICTKSHFLAHITSHFPPSDYRYENMKPQATVCRVQPASTPLLHSSPATFPTSVKPDNLPLSVCLCTPFTLTAMIDVLPRDQRWLICRIMTSYAPKEPF